MKKRYLLLPVLIFTFAIGTLVAFSAGAAGACSAAAGDNRMFVASDEVYAASLSGDMEVPSVDTMAMGEAMLLLDEQAGTMRYALRVQDMDNVTAAHIHMGMQGQNGGVVVALSTMPQGGITQGTITNADLVGAMAGKTIMDLEAEIERGNMYVNVHSREFPNGEIRGQLMRR